MISVVYSTFRGPYPFLDEPLRHMSQYDVLSDCLRAQTFVDYELIVVQKVPLAPRRELSWLGDRVRFVEQKHTPWDELEAFNPSAARNTGLEMARGDVVFFLDDCTSFGRDLLGKIAAQAMIGRCLVPVYMRYVATPNPAGGTRFEIEPWYWKDSTHCGGIVVVPRQACIDAGGWEERFAGTTCREDWEFSERMSRRGVVFSQLQDATVTLERHQPRTVDYLRCPHAVAQLVEGQDRANGKWTVEQLQALTAAQCPFLYMTQGKSPSRMCLARNKRGCVYKQRPGRRAIEIMRQWEFAA